MFTYISDLILQITSDGLNAAFLRAPAPLRKTKKL